MVGTVRRPVPGVSVGRPKSGVTSVMGSPRLHAQMEAPDLYALPLERFVPERAVLAKSLRDEQRRDEAARVSALRKPSIAAWAVNQLARTQRVAVEDLFEAG